MDPAQGVDLDEARLGELTARVRAALTDSLIGVWLHGSAVLGGLRPGSDLDLLVVVRAALSDHQRSELSEVMLDLSGRPARRGPGRPVELTVVLQDEVRPWRYPPRCEYLYGEWLRGEVENGVLLEPFVSPDLAVVLSVAVQRGRTLAGPPIAAVLDPVPVADVLRGGLAGLPGLLADLGADTANVLLTLARIRVTFYAARVVPKDVAVDALLPFTPPALREPFERARAVYLGLQPDEWEDLADASRAAAEWLRNGLTESAEDPG